MKSARTLKDIGLLIRFHRKKKGLSQKELAELCDLSQVAISKLESGSGSSLDTLLLAMRALQVELTLAPIRGIDTANLLGLLE